MYYVRMDRRKTEAKVLSGDTEDDWQRHESSAQSGEKRQREANLRLHENWRGEVEYAKTSTVI